MSLLQLRGSSGEEQALCSASETFGLYKWWWGYSILLKVGFYILQLES